MQRGERPLPSALVFRHSTWCGRRPGSLLYDGMALGKSVWRGRSDTSLIFVRRDVCGSVGRLEDAPPFVRIGGHSVWCSDDLGYIGPTVGSELRSALLRLVYADRCLYGQPLFAPGNPPRAYDIAFGMYSFVSGSFGIDPRPGTVLQRVGFAGADSVRRLEGTSKTQGLSFLCG